MTPEEAAQCHYIPLSALDRAVTFVEAGFERPPCCNYCSRDLRQQQNIVAGSTRKVRTTTRGQTKYFNNAVSRAIYAHDWDKLLWLLKASPIWELHGNLTARPFYTKAMTILLMNHPSAKAQNLLHEYIHMVCACRTDVEKKAMMKAILTLPEKIPVKNVYVYQKKPPKERYGDIVEY